MGVIKKQRKRGILQGRKPRWEGKVGDVRIRCRSIDCHLGGRVNIQVDADLEIP